MILVYTSHMQHNLAYKPLDDYQGRKVAKLLEHALGVEQLAASPPFPSSLTVYFPTVNAAGQLNDILQARNLPSASLPYRNEAGEANPDPVITASRDYKQMLENTIRPSNSKAFSAVHITDIAAINDLKQHLPETNLIQLGMVNDATINKHAGNQLDNMLERYDDMLRIQLHHHSTDRFR